MTVKQNEPTLKGHLVRGRILAILRTEERNGRFLSIREIGEAVGLHSSSTVWNHITRLRREGRITTSRYGHSRSIRYIKKPEEICTCCGGSGFTGTEVVAILTYSQHDDLDIPGTELIDDKRSPEDRSFGH